MALIARALLRGLRVRHDPLHDVLHFPDLGPPFGLGLVGQIKQNTAGGLAFLSLSLLSDGLSHIVVSKRCQKSYPKEPSENHKNTKENTRNSRKRGQNS